MIAVMSLRPSEDEAAPSATSRPGAFQRRRPNAPVRVARSCLPALGERRVLCSSSAVIHQVGLGDVDRRGELAGTPAPLPGLLATRRRDPLLYASRPCKWACPSW